MTVALYLAEWLNAQELSVQRSTHESLSVYFNRHLIPYFEKLGIDLCELKAKHIQAYAKQKLTNGRMDGKKGGLSLVSVRKHISVLKQALNDAVIEEYIPNNPANFVKLQRQKKGITQRTVLAKTEDAQKIIESFRGHRLYEAVVICLYYGLRKSELLGLRWSAIDFENNTLSINHTVVKCSTIECKDSTKTDSSRRTFPLFPEIKEMLLQMRKNCAVKSSYVFCRKDGSPLRPDSTLKAFQRVLVKNGFPKMRLHDLRHSTATILFDKGLSVEDVQHWLGHTDIETTMNIYVHYQESRKLLTMTALEGMFTI